MKDDWCFAAGYNGKDNARLSPPCYAGARWTMWIMSPRLRHQPRPCRAERLLNYFVSRLREHSISRLCLLVGLGVHSIFPSSLHMCALLPMAAFICVVEVMMATELEQLVYIIEPDISIP